MSASPSSFLDNLAAAWPAARWRDVTVLVAVSGGADSIALARGMTEIRTHGEGRLVLAHFNHRLRGAESEADAAFVGELGKQLGLHVEIGEAQGDLAASGSGEGLEGAARRARYDFLALAAGRYGARYIATAHTADDQVETVLFNILRGTGLAGLAGIPRLRQLCESTTIIRPLLGITRFDVLAYLTAIRQPYRDDSTNQLTDFTRNRIRWELLPQLERDFNPRVRDAICRLSQIASEADSEINRLATELFQQVSRPIPGGIELNITPLRLVSEFLVRATLMAAWRSQNWPFQAMTFEKWEQLARLALADNPNSHTEMFPGGIRVESRDNQLRLLDTDVSNSGENGRGFRG